MAKSPFCDKRTSSSSLDRFRSEANGLGGDLTCDSKESWLVWVSTAAASSTSASTAVGLGVGVSDRPRNAGTAPLGLGTFNGFTAGSLDRSCGVGFAGDEETGTPTPGNNSASFDPGPNAGVAVNEFTAVFKPEGKTPSLTGDVKALPIGEATAELAVAFSDGRNGSVRSTAGVSVPSSLKASCGICSGAPAAGKGGGRVRENSISEAGSCGASVALAPLKSSESCDDIILGGSPFGAVR